MATHYTSKILSCSHEKACALADQLNSIPGLYFCAAPNGTYLSTIYPVDNARKTEIEQIAAQIIAQLPTIGISLTP